MSSRPIAEIEAEIIDEFEYLEDWMDKYQFIIDLGKELPNLTEEQKTDDNIVRGCQSQVWLVAEEEAGKIVYHADSDAMITKGLIALLVRVFSGHQAKEILQNDLAFIDRIGVREHLSPNRSNGLNAMIKQMKLYALAFQTRQQGRA